MAVPKRRSSNSRTNRRRAHKHLTPKSLTYCTKCSTAILPHIICPNCGAYHGRAMVEAESAPAAKPEA